MTADWRQKTKGIKALIDMGDGKDRVMIAGGRKRLPFPDQMDPQHEPCVVLVNATIKMADGTTAHALIEIDEQSSGEHCGTAIFTPDGQLAWQNDGLTRFLRILGKTREQVFPYTYRYHAPLNCVDIHTDDNGWGGS